MLCAGRGSACGLGDCSVPGHRWAWLRQGAVQGLFRSRWVWSHRIQIQCARMTRGSCSCRRPLVPASLKGASALLLRLLLGRECQCVGGLVVVHTACPSANKLFRSGEQAPASLYSTQPLSQLLPHPALRTLVVCNGQAQGGRVIACEP